METFDGAATFIALRADSSLPRGSEWDREVAEELARINGIGPLTADHWRVIDFVRSYYLEHGLGPSAYQIHRATGFNLQRLFELFPGSISWNAHSIAGVPHPGKVSARMEPKFQDRDGRSLAREKGLEKDAGTPYKPSPKRACLRRLSWVAVPAIAILLVMVILKSHQENSMHSLAIVPMTKIEAVAGKGLVEVPLELVKRNKLVSFEYMRPDGPVPLLAYMTPSGRVVTAIGLSEPCNSKSFHIEGDDIVCNLCLTHWKLDTLEPVKGDCWKYPLDMLTHAVYEGRLILREADLQHWKPRPLQGNEGHAGA